MKYDPEQKLILLSRREARSANLFRQFRADPLIIGGAMVKSEAQIVKSERIIEKVNLGYCANISTSQLKAYEKQKVVSERHLEMLSQAIHLMIETDWADATVVEAGQPPIEPQSLDNKAPRLGD